MPLDSMFSSVRRKVEREVRERMSSLAPAPLDQGSRSDSLPGSSQDAHPAAAAGGGSSGASSSEVSERLLRIEQVLEALMENRFVPQPHLNISESGSVGEGSVDLGSPRLASRQDIDMGVGAGRRSPCPSILSQATALRGTAIERMIYKMEQFKQKFTDFQKGHLFRNISINKHYLGEAKALCEKCENLQLENCALSPNEEEAINDLYMDVRGIEESLVVNLGELSSLSEERRNLKIEVPRYDGSPILFHSWIRDFQKVTQSLSTEERRTALISAISDKEAKARVSNCASYQQQLDALHLAYGDPQAVGSQYLARLADLASPGMDDLQTEVSNVQKIRTYLNFMMSANIQNVGSIEKELIAQKVRRINREKLVTDPRGLGHITNSELLDIFDGIYRDNSKILSSIKTANSLAKNNSKSSPAAQDPKSSRYQGGTKAVVVQATSVAGPDRESCGICSQTGHNIPACPELSGGDPKVIRSLLMSASRCVVCAEPWAAGHKCGREYCRPCRMGRMFCPCNQKPGGAAGQAKDKKVAGGRAAAARQGTQSGTSPRHNNTLSVTSNFISIRPQGEILVKFGQAIIPKENISIQGEQVTCIYDSASSDCILDSSFEHLCSNVHVRAVDFTTANQTMEELPVKSGDLEIITNTGQVVKVQVIIMELSNIEYDLLPINIPEDWVQTYSIPSPFNTGGYRTGLILSISFISQLGPLPLSSHEGMVLSISQLTGEYILSGFNKNLNQEKGVTCNRANFGKLSRMDQEFFNQNLLDEPHPLREGHCPKCRMQLCGDCATDPFSMSPVTRAENSLIKQGITFENKYYQTEIPFTDAIRDLPLYRKEVTAAMQRFEKKIVKTPGHLSSYNEQVDQLLQTGVFELVEDEDQKNTGSYLPCNIALNSASASTPIRLVQNGSFSSQGSPSVNSCMVTGSSGN